VWECSSMRGSHAEVQLPGITIITPSFNQSRFLETAIRSVLEQEYPDLEYIVLDGGSTDGSVEIIERYAERIDYWHSGPDDGQASAINQGWEMARGEVLGWLNSDDRLEPGALGAVGEAFGNDPSLQIAYGDCRIVDRGGRQIRRKRSENYTMQSLLRGGSLPQPAVFLRRSFVQKLRGLEAGLQHALDWEFFLRAFLLCSESERRYLPTVLAASREYEGTKTRTGLAAKGQERREVLVRLRDSGPLEDVSPAEYRRAMGGTFWIQAVDQWLAGRNLAAMRSLVSAVMRDPARLFRKPRTIPWFFRERVRRGREKQESESL